MPLESNPDMLTSFIGALGVKSPARFVDIWSLDEENLGFFPAPILAVCVLYPSDKVDAARTKDIKDDRYLMSKDSAKCTYIKQVPTEVGNACGTIAVAHAVCNNLDLLSFSEESVIPAFAAKCRPASPEEAAAVFLAETKLHSITSTVAEQGQTATPSADDDVNHHFITFVLSEDAHLVELDGMKKGPVDHGPCTIDMLLRRALEIVRDDMMVRDPSNVNFNAMGLTIAEEEG